jgi:hypothetical protein
VAAAVRMLGAVVRLSRLVLLLVLVSVTSGCWNNRYEAIAWWNELRGDAYPLDAIPREVEPTQDGERLTCPDVLLARHGGDAIRYERPVTVAEPFQDKLRAFEAIVAEVARAHYGRTPERILHFGAYVCRTIRGREDRLSEHAFGNALDVSGFRFARMGAQEALPDGMPTPLRRAFLVSVRRHWAGDGQDEVAEAHRRYLHALVETLRAQGIFRGVTGPTAQVPAGHLHFDYAPWRYTRL